MLIFGLALLAITIIGLWLCSPGQDSKMKPFLTRGVEILAGIAITAGLGVGLLMIVIGLGG
jgi:hypothetical protein